MAETEKHRGEDIEKVLRRFKRAMKDEGVIDELKKREYYEKPSEKRMKAERTAQLKEHIRRTNDW